MVESETLVRMKTRMIQTNNVFQKMPALQSYTGNRYITRSLNDKENGWVIQTNITSLIICEPYHGRTAVMGN